MVAKGMAVNGSAFWVSELRDGSTAPGCPAQPERSELSAAV